MIPVSHTVVHDGTWGFRNHGWMGASDKCAMQSMQLRSPFGGSAPLVPFCLAWSLWGPDVAHLDCWTGL